MPVFDRFDICEAYYLLSRHYAGNPKLDTVRYRLKRMQFKPKPILVYVELEEEVLTENGLAIYRQWQQTNVPVQEVNV